MGVPVSQLLLHPWTPQCLPRSGGGGLLLPLCPTTLPKICVCAPVGARGGAALASWGLCRVPSLGLSFLSGWLRKEGGAAFSAWQISVAFISQSAERPCRLFLVLGPKSRSKHIARVVQGGPPPSQSRMAAFQTQPQTLFTWVGRWDRGIRRRVLGPWAAGTKVGTSWCAGIQPLCSLIWNWGGLLPSYCRWEVGGGAQPLQCLNEA